MNETVDRILKERDPAKFALIQKERKSITERKQIEHTRRLDEEKTMKRRRVLDYSVDSTEDE